jgi:hypothetical protein
LKTKGIASVSPSNPTLLALLDAGATLEEFETAADKSATAKASKPFSYLLSVMVGERQQAKELAGTLQTGAMPASNQSKPSNGRPFRTIKERDDLREVRKYEATYGRIHPDRVAMGLPATPDGDAAFLGVAPAGEVIDIETIEPLKLQ